MKKPRTRTCTERTGIFITSKLLLLKEKKKKERKISDYFGFFVTEEMVEGVVEQEMQGIFIYLK